VLVRVEGFGLEEDLHQRLELPTLLAVETVSLPHAHGALLGSVTRELPGRAGEDARYCTDSLTFASGWRRDRVAISQTTAAARAIPLAHSLTRRPRTSLAGSIRRDST